MRLLVSLINALPLLTIQVMITLALCTYGRLCSSEKERAGALELLPRIEKNAHGSALHETKEEKKGNRYAS